MVGFNGSARTSAGALAGSVAGVVAAGVEGTRDHHGPMIRAVSATAPVTCAINGVRAVSGSQRGQSIRSSRPAIKNLSPRNSQTQNCNQTNGRAEEPGVTNFP